MTLGVVISMTQTTHCKSNLLSIADCQCYLGVCWLIEVKLKVVVELVVSGRCTAISRVHRCTDCSLPYRNCQVQCSASPPT